MERSSKLMHSWKEVLRERWDSLVIYLFVLCPSALLGLLSAFLAWSRVIGILASSVYQ